MRKGTTFVGAATVGRRRVLRWEEADWWTVLMVVGAAGRAATGGEHGVERRKKGENGEAVGFVPARGQMKRVRGSWIVAVVRPIGGREGVVVRFVRERGL